MPLIYKLTKEASPQIEMFQSLKLVSVALHDWDVKVTNTDSLLPIFS